MIKAKADGIVYNIPTSWTDITYSCWRKIQGVEDEYQMLSIISGMPIDIIELLNDRSKIRLASALEFMKSDINLDEYECPDFIKMDSIDIPIVENIGSCTFGQKIEIHELLKNNSEDIFKILPNIVMIYSQPYIDGGKFSTNRVDELLIEAGNLPLMDLYSTALNYINQLKDIINVEVDKLSVTPTSEQIQAGINMYDKFGVMNTIRALSKGDPLKYQKILDLEYNVVLVSLEMARVDNIFQENYREIYKRKSKTR